MLKHKLKWKLLQFPTTHEMRCDEPRDTGTKTIHLGYDAEIQYKRKDPAVRMILCSSLDDRCW